MTLTESFRSALEETWKQTDGTTRWMLLNSLAASAHGIPELDAEYRAFVESKV